MKVWEQFKKTVIDNRLIAPGDSVLAAVSGGPDSVCLLHLLMRLRRTMRFALSVVHFDHGLRPRAAEKDSDFVRRLAERSGLPVHVIPLSVRTTADKAKKSIEETGRMLRYRSFEELVHSCGYTKIALAHHRDDQAETVLFRIIRGTAGASARLTSTAVPSSQGASSRSRTSPPR